MGKSKKRKLALFLVLCLLMTGMPHVSMRVYADPPANVYMIWATFEGDAVVAIEISNVQPEGMEPFAKLVTGGTYTMSEADNGLGLIVNNATVYTNGMDVAF